MKQHPTWLLIGLLLLFTWILVHFGLQDMDLDMGPPQRIEENAAFDFPVLNDEAYDWIAAGIYRNETGGKVENLTHWGRGEDFPSLGIGHFIWFPTGVDAPFDEQFPAMFDYVVNRSSFELQPPGWLQKLEPFDAPWTSKREFDDALATTQLQELRDWLDKTRRYQAMFIVKEFIKRWNNVLLAIDNNKKYKEITRQLLQTPEGLFALIDYYNFKGLGTNERERYQGEGWGLLQVLQAMADGGDGHDDLLREFRDAAAGRLALRVNLAPPERNEARWMAGWLKRLDGYLEKSPLAEDDTGCGFHVRPYLQNPAEDAITISWLGRQARAGQVKIWRDGKENPELLLTSSPVLAEALAYHPKEDCGNDDCASAPLPFVHQVRASGLEPDSSYRYEVQLCAESAGGSFATPGPATDSIRFVVYADSETEPESTGKHARWPGAEASTAKRRYPVDQTVGYAQNLAVIQQRKPAFVAIAGDLVQSGGEQRDWDEFWRQNESLSASIPILPALGNHDYFAGPGALGGYDAEPTRQAIEKYRAYFDLPDNGLAGQDYAERFYAIKYGPVTLIAIDATDSQPHESEQDTNWYMRGEGDGGHAPDWRPGSAQYHWLEKQLQIAQADSAFTFVMFHLAPYTSGPHGKPPGRGRGKDPYSALPIRALTPLFMRYGVDAVFNGHDEMYERSVIKGREQLADGSQLDHEIHFFDVGIGGDGLRAPVPGVENPHRVFLVHTDAPEVYGPGGVLQNGGKHYGHLEVNLERQVSGQWRARFDPVYIFPVLNREGNVLRVERRIYDDSFNIESTKVK
jgi:hypothetical protein